MENTGDPRFRHLERKIGMFVIIGLCILTAVVFLILREKDLFTKKYTLYFTTDRGTGFAQGMPVKLSGFRIGRVASISLNEEAAVDIRLEINRRYQKWIRGDSVAKLVKEGLVGDTIVEVSVGNPKAPVLEDSARLAYVRTKGLDELAGEVAEKVKPVLQDVRDIVSYVNDPKGELKQSIHSIRVLSQKLDGTRRHADDFMVSSRSAVLDSSERVNRFLSLTEEQVKTAGPAVESAASSLRLLDRRLPSLLDRVDAGLGNVVAVTEQAKGVSASSLPRVPLLLEKTEGALDQGNVILEGMGEMWPVRSHVPAPDERRLLSGDSHE